MKVQPLPSKKNYIALLLGEFSSFIIRVSVDIRISLSVNTTELKKPIFCCLSIDIADKKTRD